MNAPDSVIRRLLFLPEQASTSAAGIDLLHLAVISTTLLGALAITLAATLFCIRYRARPDEPKHARRRSGPRPPLWVELGLIAGLFGLFVAFWGVGFWQYVRLTTPPAGSYDVYVAAKQWMWQFAYPAGQHSINTLYVPAGRPIRLILTSRDVIHSFYVPAFRIKQDAVPGRYTEAWFDAPRPGRHRVMCTEYCGTDHSRMLAEVIVLSAADYARWLQDHDGGGGPADPALLSRIGPETPLRERGQAVAARYGCLRCHTLDGSPHIGPTWAGLYGATIPLTGGGSVIADVAYLTESMMDPQAKLRRGYAPVMPSYFGYLQPGEVSALVELIKDAEPGRADSATPLLSPDAGVYAVPRDEAPARAQAQPAETSP